MYYQHPTPAASGLATWSYKSTFSQDLSLTSHFPVARLRGKDAYIDALDAAENKGSVSTQKGEIRVDRDRIGFTRELLDRAGKLVTDFLIDPQGVYFTGTGERAAGLFAADIYEPFGLDTYNVAAVGKTTGLKFPGKAPRSELVFIGKTLPVKVPASFNIASPILDFTDGWRENAGGLYAAASRAETLTRLLSAQLGVQVGKTKRGLSYVTMPVAINNALIMQAERV